MHHWLVLLGMAALSLPMYGNGDGGFFRWPALHKDNVVFTAEGDLWRVGAEGGAAQRLTSHPGLESEAAISPDGSQVAFCGRYEGRPEVYVMPIDGGLPKRLTWDGDGSVPVGWTADGRVIAATRVHSTLPNRQLVAIDPRSGLEEVLPLAQASEGDFDASGKRLVFARLPFQGSSTKRYRGGTAQQVWRYDEAAVEAEPITRAEDGSNHNPMWWGGRVLLLSDRSGVFNLWSVDPDGSSPQVHTTYDDFDIRHADLYQDQVVYQYAGRLRLLDLKSGDDREIKISLPSDFDQLRTRWVEKPQEYLTRFSLSPDGDRLVLTARGGVFVAPVKKGGRFISVPRPEGVRYREAVFMPDGESLIAQTDETGEIEMVRLSADGLGEPELLTDDGTIFRFAPVVSPDGRWTAWQDKNLELWVRDLEARESVKVSESCSRGFQDLSWSPDSRWLAFVEPATNTYKRIRLYELETRKVLDATGDRVISTSPAWSADGKWLYFLSDRELRTLVGSPWGARQPEPFFTESTRIYALSLQRGTRFPFTPPDELSVDDKGPEEGKSGEDEPGGDEPGDSAHDDSEAGEGDDPVRVVIDADGLAERLYEVPGPKGNLGRLVATPTHLFYSSRAPGLDAKQHLMKLKISDDSPEPVQFATGMEDWDFSRDGKKVAIQQGKAFYVVSTSGDAPAKLKDAVSLRGWQISINPREEWRQIYRESWRMLRDYFYDPAMHGVDWEGIRKKYEPMVDRVTDRSELSEVLHEMSGELSALHIYVRFGDLREGPDSIEPSSLGARLTRSEANDGWRIDHIYRSDPDYPNRQSPLARPGVDVAVGDVILRINGRDVGSVDHPQELLAAQAGQSVRLDLRTVAGEARSVIVRPLSPDAAADLRYAEWEYTRRLETERLGEGKIGYVHLRSMGAGSIIEWARDFYPVFDRQGLVIDLRHNRGGNIDSWILGRLLRKAWFYWSPRVGQPYSNMQFAFRGHITVLCNEFTASDGEAFCEGFTRLGLGQVIGTRTWGGQIWLSARSWLVDNGMCSAAEIGVYGPEGEWLIEGHGFEPAIVVDNPPHQTFSGKDLQLEAAVKHLQELIEKDPRPVPQPPLRPDKSR